ncbi:bcl-2-like protein 1 isoform X4 [Entelurus aequoreus]|uniref:bcl-2-like protein 1 isoform X4 n=1 Tax=Entelurus aequoreus TaxID=161455 RepID=UPI002B1E40CA|nr:bcl-2-like protein 1 isoform X4 [Entelurus aequoreus]XP_061919784.1 bcl-2-like protein 1 isoform X4 [Entelurus aequoreus]
MYPNRELVEFYVKYKLAQRNYPSPLLMSKKRESYKAPEVAEKSASAPDEASGDHPQTPWCPHGDMELVKAALQYSVDRFELLFAQRFSNLDSYIDIIYDATYGSFKMTMDQVFQDGINWGRIVGLFAFGGIICVKCAERGLSDLVPYIVDWMTNYLDEHISTWIQSHGGWDYFAEVFLDSSATEVGKQPEKSLSPWMLAGGTVLTGALVGMLVWRLK